jgi:type IV pilus biogenesis/stability protein PilW
VRSFALILVGILALPTVGCVTAKRQERAQARVDLGVAYLREGTSELAIATLREATELDPRNVDAWDRLGLALMSRGAHVEAEHAFERAMVLAPKSASVSLNYSYLLLNLNRPEEAVVLLTGALEDLTYRNPARILNNLGYAELIIGQNDRAIAHLSEAVARSANYCDAWYNLGLAQEAAGSNINAIESYDRVVMLCPAQADGSYIKAAELFILEGNLSDGLHYLQQACSRNPGSEVARSAADLMRDLGETCLLGPTPSTSQ